MSDGDGVLTLALALLAAQTPQHRLFLQPNLPRASMAFFEAFNGAGTSGACSTTPPTGARGEVLTFTRASSATCTRTAASGLATTGIADGDISVMTSNQPRVEYDSAGTLGLLVEAARTNQVLRSEEFDNASWTKGAGMTVTANYATAPDGTLTADRLEYTAANGAYALQSYGAGGITTSGSVYLKGTSGSGSIDFCRGGATLQCVVCTYVSTSWTRCAQTSAYATSNNIFLGCDAPTKGSACSAAGDVLAWGVQGETGAYATSYIPTTSAAVTRAADSAGAFTISALGPSGCIAASVTWPSTAVGAVNLAAFGAAGAGNNWTLYRTSDTAAGYQIGTTTSAPAVSSMGTATHRTVLTDNAGTRAAWWDAASVAAPAASLSGTQTVVWVGAGVSGGTPANGIVSRVQLDPDVNRCAR